MNEYSINITPDLKALIDSLIENIGLPMEELINLGIFLYHPDTFMKLNENNIGYVKLWLFLDRTELDWLKTICEYYNKTENEIIMDLFQ